MRAMTPSFSVPRVCFLSQEEEAGAALQADGLLLLALADLQLKLFFPPQVLRPPGSYDASEHGPGDSR